jgi:hypothetical protein
MLPSRKSVAAQLTGARIECRHEPDIARSQRFDATFQGTCYFERAMKKASQAAGGLAFVLPSLSLDIPGWPSVA